MTRTKTPANRFTLFVAILMLVGEGNPLRGGLGAFLIRGFDDDDGLLA